MSSVIKEMKRHTIVRYWGGDDNGAMVQITAQFPHKNVRGDVVKEQDWEGMIRLTMAEAVEVIQTLSAFVSEEARRRHQLLVFEMEKHKELEKTVFSEVSNFNEWMLRIDAPSTALGMVDKVCPIVKEE